MNKANVMKTISFLILIAFLCPACTEKDMPDRPNGPIHGDPPQVVQDTLCMYENTVLDLWDLHSIEPNDLLGKWILITYGNLESCTFSDNPGNTDELWEIEFYDWTLVRVKTLIYSFYSIYNLSDNFLEFGTFSSAQVSSDRKWAMDLLDELRLNSDKVTIKNDTLLIYYSLSTEVMILSREQDAD
jgi:hypothetical protein